MLKVKRYYINRPRSLQFHRYNARYFKQIESKQKIAWIFKKQIRAFENAIETVPKWEIANLESCAAFLQRKFARIPCNF